MSDLILSFAPCLGWRNFNRRRHRPTSHFSTRNIFLSLASNLTFATSLCKCVVIPLTRTHARVRVIIVYLLLFLYGTFIDPINEFKVHKSVQRSIQFGDVIIQKVHTDKINRRALDGQQFRQ